MFENIIGNTPVWKVAAYPFVVYVIYSYVSTFLQDRRISKLGGRAGIRKSRLPFGLDTVYEAIYYALRHEGLTFWSAGFAKYATGKVPYTIESSIGGQRLILTADVENIKAILATQFTDFGKGEQFNKEWHEFLGDSIFTTDGQKWHDARQLIRPQFIRDRLSDINIFEKHCQVLVPLLGGRGQTVDAADLFFRFTLDAATDFLLGKSVDSLHNDQTGFASAFNNVQHIQSIIARAGPLNWLVPRKAFRKDLKIMNKFTDQYIDATLRLTPDELEKVTKNEEGYTFLHALAGYTRDRTVLRDQLVAVLLAGRDTTACTLSWLFYEISKQPQVVAKLRREILDTVGPNAKPTYENLKSMKYMQVCQPCRWMELSLTPLALSQ